MHFLHEEELVDALETSLQNVLKGANSSRVFHTQSVLTALEPPQQQHSGAPASVPTAGLPLPTALLLSSSSTGAANCRTEHKQTASSSAVGSLVFTPHAPASPPAPTATSSPGARIAVDPAPQKKLRVNRHDEKLVRAAMMQCGIVYSRNLDLWA